MNSVTHVRTKLALALSITLAAQGALACKSPMVVRSIPEGRKAEMQAMLDARLKVVTYVRQVSDYMSCENDGLKLLEVKSRQKDVLKQFNAEVRAFKAVNGQPLAAASGS
jgi:hypothetical protein